MKKIDSGYFVQANPATHSGPRFPIWELILMFYIALYGVIGLIGEIPQTQDDVLGPATQAYSIAWIIVGILGIGGMFFKIPTGYVIQLTAMIVMAVSTTSIYVGLMFETGDILFRGSTFFGIFVVGSIVRCYQIMKQLFHLQKQVKLIVDSREENVE